MNDWASSEFAAPWHVAAPEPEPARPWRTAALVVSAIAAVELVILVVAGVVLLGRSLAPHVHDAAAQQAAATAAKPKPAAATAAARPAKATPAKPHLPAITPREKTEIMVLNGNGIQGAAAQAAAVVKARGYPVGDVTNAPRTGYAASLVMYRPGFEREGKRFAVDMNLRRSQVGPLDGLKPGQLKGAKLVYILGNAR